MHCALCIKKSLAANREIRRLSKDVDPHLAMACIFIYGRKKIATRG